MSILAIGDAHLERLDTILPGFQRGTRYQIALLKRILDAAKKDMIEHVVFLGDVFDTPSPLQRTLVALLDLLSAYPSITFHAIVGNHDAIGATDVKADTAQHSFEVYQWLAAQKKAKINVYTSPKVVNLCGKNYFFCPHPFIEDQPAKCIMSFGHFAWTGARTDSGYSTRTGHTPKGQWILGDFHTSQQGDRYRYAGSISQITFGEKDKKVYLHITDQGIVSERKSPLTYMLNKDIVVRSVKDYNGLYALQGSTMYFSIVFDGFVPPDDWQSQLPNVVKHTFENMRREGAEPSTKASLSLVFGDSKTLVKTGLDPYMKKRGLSKAEVKAGNTLIDNIVKGMRL